jgi:hypothetical protein
MLFLAACLFKNKCRFSYCTWAKIVERFYAQMEIARLIELTGESGCTKANRPYMVGWDEEMEAFYVFRPDCKCWNCEPCAARLRRRWTRRAYEGINHYIALGEEFKFVTLTSHERLVTFSQTLRVWPLAWKKLSERVRYNAKGWHWIMIPEQHRNGRLHVHLIASANLGTRWWKDNARECGLGYKAEEAEFKAGHAEPGRAAAYAAKYLDKQLGVKQWPRYFHHIRTSQHFPELPAEPDNPYDRVVWIALTPAQALTWLARRERENQPVYYTGNGEAIS